MRLHRLELAGFGPYRERQVVDFDAFEGDGIFLISGRTGAGKSSILDGVAYALYGSVPRYGSSGLRVRSDHCAPDDPTEVVLEFEASGRRLRVTRSPDHERPRARGDGLTTVPHAARLEERQGGDWIGLAAKPRDVGLLLDEVLGLTREQFLQVILLAQNRFAEFLLAKNDDRQALLRTLFGTRVYADYQAAIEERRRDGESVLAGRAAGLDVLLEEIGALVAEQSWGGGTTGGVGDVPDGAVAPDGSVGSAAPSPPGSAPERVALAEAALARGAYRAEAAATRRVVAERALRAAEDEVAARRTARARQEDRDALRARLAELEGRAAAITAARAELAAALRAASLRAPVEAADTATARLAAATEALAAARRDVAEHGDLDGADLDGADPAGLDAVALTAAADGIAAGLAGARAAAETEAALADHEAALALLHAEAASAEAAILALDAAREALPGVVAGLDERIVLATSEAAAGEGAQEAARTTAEALAAARDAASLGSSLRDAEAAHLAAAAALGAATDALHALLRRRLDGHAGELAAVLVEGEPCAVCGALSHPAPASAGDPVSDGDVAAAEAAVRVASAAREQAADAEAAARAAHVDALARSGGASVADLTARAEAIEARAAAATSAAESLAALREERAGRSRAAEEAERGRARLAESLAATREAVVAAAQRRDTDARAVAQARGAHPSVATRLAVDGARLARIRHLLAALAEETARAADARERAADRDDRIAASGFADADGVRAAFRDEAVVAARTAELAEHDAALRSTRDRLRERELELAGLPDEPIDTEAAEVALAAARAVRDAEAEAVIRVEQAVERLGGLLSRVRAVLAEVSEAQARHDVVAGLAAALAGRTPSRMDLETFVLAAELEEIVAAANLRLDEMSAGRYRLRHTDALAARGAASGLGIEVVDAHTGRARPPQSLSGGESFLASLALALGLAEVVTARAGGIRLDTLFIDEGFGSLDADTLDVAMRTLDALRQGGRTVGVISHVEAMKEQIAARVEVVATPQGPSVVRQGG